MRGPVVAAERDGMARLERGGPDSKPGRIHGGQPVMLRTLRQADRDDARGDEIGAQRGEDTGMGA